MSNTSIARGVNTPKKKPARVKGERLPSKVNPRHEQVANALMEGVSESEALRAAGYHPSNASNVIRQEVVQELLAEARAEITDLTTIKRLDVLKIFLEAIDMSRLLADPGQMINGADKIAKMMGYYAPEVKEVIHTDGSARMQAKFKQMTDEELINIAAGNAKVIEGEVIETSAADKERT